MQLSRRELAFNAERKRVFTEVLAMRNAVQKAGLRHSIDPAFLRAAAEEADRFAEECRQQAAGPASAAIKAAESKRNEELNLQLVWQCCWCHQLATTPCYSTSHPYHLTGASP